MKLGRYLIPLLLFACEPKTNTLDIEQVRVEVDYAQSQLPEYCSREETDDERNSILASFVGDHQSSYIYASRRRYAPRISNDEIDLSTVFSKVTSKRAVDEIVEQSDSYHFTMINEAHYCGQHRVFTASLLQPLWEKGYRYLALETLGYYDSLMNERAFPIVKTGYYIMENSFGNMVREALTIGYELIPYETRFMGQSSTHRDSVQATNLINQTIRKDSLGKVLVHVGYGHLFEESGSSYKPMGFWVKNMTGLDILTIDQVAMTDASLASKIHPYYEFATQNFPISEPIVFKNVQNDFLIDPVQQRGIDMQVYHPRVEFINGRPNWLMNDTVDEYPLPEELFPFEGYLFFVIKRGEPLEAIPVDQIIISKEKKLLLAEGQFDAYVVDCSNKVLAQFELNTN